MATARVNGLLGRLRRVVQPPHVRLSDAQLLEHYLVRRDESAFAEMLRRHGRMVLGVCRRVLGHEQDAEDAFQATFLVLVRKAASIRPRALVGNWLYGVAFRTAAKAKVLAARRRRKEREMAKPTAMPANTADDLHAFLDRELDALPDKYRAAIVLCDLEGKTRHEAAVHLGWPEGTVAGRLARGRALLARRLARRGLTVSAATALLTHSATAAPVPAALFAATVEAGTLLAAGNAAGAVCTNILALAEGVVRATFLTKLKLVAGMLTAIALAVVAASTLDFRADAAQGSDPEKTGQPSGKKEAPRPTAGEAFVDRPSGDKAKQLMEKLYHDPLTFIHNSKHSCLACHMPPGAHATNAQFKFRLQIEHALWKLGRTGDREADLDLLEEIERAVQDLRRHLRKRKG